MLKEIMHENTTLFTMKIRNPQVHRTSQSVASETNSAEAV